MIHGNKYSKKQPWQSLLAQPQKGHHIDQIYQDLQFLTEAVSLYLGAGVFGKEGVIVIASKEHWLAFRRRLEEQGFHPDQAIQSGQLQFFDAEAMLSKFMIGGKPDWDLFQRLIGGVIERLREHYPTIRAYGEMVDVLW